LERLLRHLRGQTRPLDTVDELVITHEGLSALQQQRLERVAGRAITFVQVPPGTDYYAAKNAGWEATKAPIVAFGDADCWPAPEWLEALLTPFEEDPSVQAVAGRTTYRSSLFGTAASAIDFMYFPSPLGPGCTRNFYANNIAFRRDAFEGSRYAEREGFYRGNCQTLGLRLQALRVPVRFVPAAHTTHRLPDTLRELFMLRLLRGADAVELAPHLGNAYLPQGLRWLSRLGVLSGAATLGARFGYSTRAINHQDLPRVRGLRFAACVGLVGAITAMDGLGALLHPWLRRGQRAEAARTALSYHEDVDRLRGAA